MHTREAIDIVDLDSMRSVSLKRSTGVYRAESYGEFLARAVWTHARGDTACDLTSGSGLHAITMAMKGLQVVAIDLSPDAVALAADNAALNGVSLSVRCGDTYEALEPEEQFDVLVAWPPVMPTPTGSSGTSDAWWELSNSGGSDGRRVFDAIIAGARAHLSAAGVLMTLHPWYFDAQKTEELAGSVGLDVDWRHVKRFPMGVLSRARLPYLRQLGFEPLGENGNCVQVMQFVIFSRTT